MDSNKIKAIETTYKGCRFRSRLEARWAVFYNALGIQWQYEREGFDCDGFFYLPDFYLPVQRYWIEVRGRMIDDMKDMDSLAFLCRKKEEKGFAFFGDIPYPYPAAGEDCKRLGFLGAMCDSMVSCGTDLVHPPGAINVLDPFQFSPNERGREMFTPFWWCICPECSYLGVTALGDSRFLECGHGGCPEEGAMMRDDHFPNSFDHPRIISAYRAARSARFEHGESGSGCP